MPEPTLAAELLLDLKLALGEGAIWNPLTHRLLFVDIKGQRVHEYDPVARKQRSIATPEMVGTVVPRKAGGLIIALAGGLASVDAHFKNSHFLVSPAEHDPALCRFNDGKCDPQGRLWAGTMSLTFRPGEGSLYRFAAGSGPRQMLTKVSISNGLAWSPDGAKLYYIDSLTGRVDAFAFDGEKGEISDRRTAFALPAGVGLPDGSTMDAEGMLWVAHWDGARVSRWDPVTGRCLATVTVPAPQVTSCAFGGEGLKTLYITSARDGMKPEQLAAFPEAGGIFACEPGVAGMPACVFAG